MHEALDAQLRASPGSAEHAALLDYLRRLEVAKGERGTRDPSYDSRWADLRKTVRPIAVLIAGETRTDPEEVLAELCSAMHESWIREWLMITLGVAPGKSKPAYQFFHDRLRDQIRASKRTAERRARLAEEGTTGLATGSLQAETGELQATINTASIPGPEDDIRAMEALGEFASLSLRTKAVLALVAFGFSQQEIAEVTGTSPATVSRVLGEARRHVAVYGSLVRSGTYRPPDSTAFLAALRAIEFRRRAALALHFRGFSADAIASALDTNDSILAEWCSLDDVPALSDYRTFVPRYDAGPWPSLLDSI